MNGTVSNDQLKIEPIVQFLTPRSHDRARAIGALQPTPTLRKQAYLNTLAVYAVHYYLLDHCDRWSEIEASDSTHPIYQILDGAAGVDLARDLLIPQVGNVDCCVLLPNETAIAIPAETLCDRAAYVAVRFHQNSLEEVEMLGFFASFDPVDAYTKVEVGNQKAGWQPMSELGEYLDKYQKFQDLRESLELSDVIACRLWCTAKGAKSKVAMLSPFRSILKPSMAAATKGLPSGFRSISTDAMQQDVSELAAQLAAKFAEILGLE
jgi:Protein of unknown function (DUF1822)